MENLGFEQLKISAVKKLQYIQLNSPPKDQNDAGKIPKIEKKDNLVNTSISNTDVPVRYMLRQLEKKRQTQTESAIQERLKKFKNFSDTTSESSNQEWLMKQQRFINSQLQKESDILNKLSNYDKLISNRNEELNQLYQQQQQQRKAQAEELKEKQRKAKETLEKAVKLYKEFSTQYGELLSVLRTCLAQDELKRQCSQDFVSCNSIKECFEELLKLCKQQNVSDVEKYSIKLEEFKVLKEKIEGIAKTVNGKVTEKNTSAPPPPAPIVPPVQDKPPPVQPTPQLPPQVVQKPEQPKDVIDSSLSQYVSPNNYKLLCDITIHMEKHAASFSALLNDDRLKKFRFDCKKAVNIPVNAISDVNSSHLIDKYKKLHKLLSGENVTMDGQYVNASKHPHGIAFCLNLLAKKFVLQGDIMISSNPTAAFCYATIISSLWNDFPIFGKLFLGYLYKYCPYLVPYYIPQQVGESDEEFYQKRGYQYNNEQIEKHDKFLKRMTGIMRLYGALLITPPKRGQNQIPHGLENGWRWLSSILKLAPEVDITATMVHTFLETAGYSMDKAYGHSFKRLVKIIVQQFLPSCNKICTGGAGARLESILSDYLKTGQFEKPEGFCETPTW